METISDDKNSEIIPLTLCKYRPRGRRHVDEIQEKIGTEQRNRENSSYLIL